MYHKMLMHDLFPLHFDTLDGNVVSQINIVLKVPRCLLQVLLEWYIWRTVIITLKQVYIKNLIKKQWTSSILRQYLIHV